MANYAVAADFLNNDLDAEVARVQGEVENAVRLGARTFRHDGAWGLPKDGSARTFQQALPRIAEGCRRVTEYAAARGIRTMVENHGTFLQDSLRLEQLVAAVDHANFGLLVDMGNFLCADEAPEAAVGRLAPYAFHAHAKDFLYKPCTARDPGRTWFATRAGAYLRGTVIGHGVVPVEAALRILQRAGFDDVVAIEFEAWSPAWRPCSSGTRTCRPCCKKKKRRARNRGFRFRARNVFFGWISCSGPSPGGRRRGRCLALGAVAVGELRGEIRAVAEGEERVLLDQEGVRLTGG